MWELWASEKNSKYNWTDYSNCRIEWKKKPVVFMISMSQEKI